jgi:hypothetical protein
MRVLYAFFDVEVTNIPEDALVELLLVPVNRFEAITAIIRDIPHQVTGVGNLQQGQDEVLSVITSSLPSDTPVGVPHGDPSNPVSTVTLNYATAANAQDGHHAVLSRAAAAVPRLDVLDNNEEEVTPAAGQDRTNSRWRSMTHHSGSGSASQSTWGWWGSASTTRKSNPQ